MKQHIPLLTKNFNAQDPALEPLLIKMADFHIKAKQFSPAIKVLEKSLILAEVQSESKDKRVQLSKMTNLF